MVIDRPVEPGDDAGISAGTCRIQDLDGIERDTLGNTVGGATDGAGHVRAMPVVIITRSAIGVVTLFGPSAEFVMGEPDAGIENVGIYRSACCVVGVTATEWAIYLINAVESPGSG